MIFYLIGFIFLYVIIGCAAGIACLDFVRWIRVLAFIFWPIALPIIGIVLLFGAVRAIFTKD